MVHAEAGITKLLLVEVLVSFCVPVQLPTFQPLAG
jgi:hypothetical protein